MTKLDKAMEELRCSAEEMADSALVDGYYGQAIKLAAMTPIRAAYFAIVFFRSRLADGLAGGCEVESAMGFERSLQRAAAREAMNIQSQEDES